MCSYCGCDSIEVIGRFMDEHVEVINATGELREAVAAGGAAELASAKARVGELLWPHTEAEEVGLFTVLRRQDEFAGHIERLCAEHAGLDEALGAIGAGDLAAMRDFEDLLREHINKEDNGLFPAAAVALAGAEWEEVNRSTPGATGYEPSSHTHGEDHHHDHPHDHGQHHDHPFATGVAAGLLQNQA